MPQNTLNPLQQRELDATTNHGDTAFELDKCLQNSCFTLIDWPLSRVLLKNNADYPWLILVPRRADISEITHLIDADQMQLMKEISFLAQIVERIFKPHKINMGSLGNIVSQFHFHVVARDQHDPLWPQGIWQANNLDNPYLAPQVVIDKLKPELVKLF